MSGHLGRKQNDAEYSPSPPISQQHLQLPFTNESVASDDFASNADSTQSYDKLQTRPGRSPSSISIAHLSSSHGQKTPARSFYHQASQAALGMDTYASRTCIRKPRADLVDALKNHNTPLKACVSRRRN